MTSERPWQARLDETLECVAALTAGGNPRISVLGIGNELRGDDAAGVAVARALAPLTDDRLQVIEGAHAPENQLGIICNFDPGLVVLIDAVDMGRTPGEIAWIGWRETSGISASTHTMPPYMVGKYLQAMTDCQVALIGIQPSAMEMDTRMSGEVHAAVSDVSRHLMRRFA